MSVKKLFFALLFLVGLPYILSAQMYTNLEPNPKPFAGEQVSVATLFSLDESDVNFHFTVALPGGNFIIIEWDRLSYWRDKADLQNIIAIAKAYESQIDDSFHEKTSAKLIGLHLPVGNNPVTMMYSEHSAGSNVMIFKDNRPEPLKMNMDTIRVVKTLDEKVVKSKTELVQLQYTFLLKDIGQIQSLDNDPALIEKIAYTFDSIVMKYRRRWSAQDSWDKNLTVNYYPLQQKHQLTAVVNNAGPNGKSYTPLEIEYNLGISLVRSTLCPYVDGGISYKWPTVKKSFLFARVSYSAFIENVMQTPTAYNVYDEAFVNGEFGVQQDTRINSVPSYQLSFGYGHNISQPSKYTDPSLPLRLNTLFIKWKLSKIFTLSYNVYFDKLGKNDQGISGITASARIF
jgi:hypothetical protein